MAGVGFSFQDHLRGVGDIGCNEICILTLDSILRTRQDKGLAPDLLKVFCADIRLIQHQTELIASGKKVNDLHDPGHSVRNSTGMGVGTADDQRIDQIAFHTDQQSQNAAVGEAEVGYILKIQRLDEFHVIPGHVPVVQPLYFAALTMTAGIHQIAGIVIL